MESIVFEKITTFFVQYKHQTFKKGEIIIRADDSPSGIFYIQSGMVKKYAISQKGDELVVNIFKKESFFPMSWAMNLTPNTFYYEAITDCDVWRAPREKVIEFIKNEPDVLYDLLSRVYNGTDGMATRMLYLMAGSAYARLVSELIIQAHRFGDKNETKVTMTISEKELAAQTGMTRETVSREIRILKDAGLLTLSKNQIIIADLKKLQSEIEGGV